MSSRSTSTLPAARKNRSNLTNPITGSSVPPGSSWRRLPEVHVLKRQADRHGAVSDRRCDPLDRAAAHIADGEDTRLAGLQHRWPPGVLGFRSGPGGWLGGDPGLYVAAVVQVDEGAEPAGAGGRADEDEQRAGLDGTRCAGLAVLDQDGLQRLVPEQFPYLR